MRLWPEALAARIALVLALAFAAVAALDLAVNASDARRAAAPPPPDYEPEPPPAIRLFPVQGPIRLALREAAVPAEVAPVVRVLAGGGHALRRPPPLPDGPAARGPAGAAVVLPAPPAALDADARATLAAVLGALIRERPIPPGRFVTLGFRLEVADLERLLGWVP